MPPLGRKTGLKPSRVRLTKPQQELLAEFASGQPVEVTSKNRGVLNVLRQRRLLTAEGSGKAQIFALSPKGTAHLEEAASSGTSTKPAAKPRRAPRAQTKRASRRG